MQPDLRLGHVGGLGSLQHRTRLRREQDRDRRQNVRQLRLRHGLENPQVRDGLFLGNLGHVGRLHGSLRLCRG